MENPQLAQAHEWLLVCLVFAHDFENKFYFNSTRFWVILEQYPNVKNVLVIPLRAFAITAIL